MINFIKSLLEKQFDLKYLGPANFILGMQIIRDCSNKKYVETIFKRFNIKDCKSMKTLIPLGVKLYVEQCPNIELEVE